MDYKIISPDNVTFMMRAGENISPERAEEAVRRALEICGYEQWCGMEIDLFEGKGASLLMASPVKENEIHIADYIFHLLEE